MTFYYTYILESENSPNRFYIGFTEDLESRLKSHNHGNNPHTSKNKPWRIKTAIAFTDRQKALNFEAYLKSASGRAFAKKRLWYFFFQKQQKVLTNSRFYFCEMWNGLNSPKIELSRQESWQIFDGYSPHKHKLTLKRPSIRISLTLVLIGPDLNLISQNRKSAHHIAWYLKIQLRGF